MAGLWEISLCLVLILISSGLSYWKQQGMEKDFLIGALRTIVQLILLGYFLNWIFKNHSLPIVLAAAFLMTFNSALHSRNRVELKYKGLLLDNLLATALAIWPLAFLGTALLHAEPLWKVEVFLPLLGMLLGNTLNGISLGVNFFRIELKSRTEEILSLMALGASQKEATSHVRDRALRMAMTPNLNSMTSVGIVSIPGMMTGQILGGNTPSEAAVTQIIIMLLITVGTYTATYFAIVLTRKNKFHADGIPCFE